MCRLRILPQVLLLVLAAAAAGWAQAPPTLGVGSRIQVTRADGSTYTGIVAPKPADPLWQFITDKGTPFNLRLDQLLSVRLLGREARITPSWPTAARSFPWAAVQTTDGQLLELGIYRWPAFDVVRDDTGLAEGGNRWQDQLAVIAVAPRTDRAPGTVAPMVPKAVQPEFEFEQVPTPKKPITPGRESRSAP